MPSKRAKLPSTSYLEPEEVRAIVEKARQDPSHGTRHFALLLFLYNSGTRISEALSVRAEDLNLDRPYTVRFYGKGKKQRVCPLWRYTAAALSRLMVAQKSPREGFVFLNLPGQPLSRDGATYILQKYVRLAMEDVPSLAGRMISPHVMRHSCAVGLLQAGVDITVIRDILGHASISTTNRYIATNLKMKREALESFWKESGFTPHKPKPWRPNQRLLSFLESL